MGYGRGTAVVQTYAAVAGVVLILVGLLGFLGTPIVGSTDGALLATDALHNIVHIATGVFGLFVAFALSGRAQVKGMLAFAVLYAVILVAVLISPTLFGLFSVAANLPLHLIHAALAGAGFATYFMARNAAGTPEPA